MYTQSPIFFYTHNCSKQGFTLLHAMAVVMDFTEDIQFFEECFKHCKQQINAKTHAGDTAINLAANSGHIENIKYLMQHGWDINEANNDGVAPLHSAVCTESEKGFEIVKFLMEHVTDINAKTSEDSTPIMYAVEKRHDERDSIHLDILNYLMDKGVDTRYTRRNDDASLLDLCKQYNESLYAPIIARLQEKEDGKLTKAEDESPEIVSNKSE